MTGEDIAKRFEVIITKKKLVVGRIVKTGGRIVRASGRIVREVGRIVLFVSDGTRANGASFLASYPSPRERDKCLQMIFFCFYCPFSLIV